MTSMTTIFFMILSILFLVYGALVFYGIHTPIKAKVMVEEEFIKEWCHTEGFVKILWGVDLALFTLYSLGTILSILFLAAFCILTIYIVYITYKNNGKYLK